MTDRCHGCAGPAPKLATYCDECHAASLRGLLDCPYWLTWRGLSAGDLPGETLADTFRRELNELEGSKQ